MRRTTGVLLATIWLAQSSCGGGGTSGPPPAPGPGPVSTGVIEGRIDYEPRTESHYLESEPNDTFDEASFVAQVAPGRRVTVLGQTDAATDPVDGFRFRTAARVRLTATITYPAPGTNAFDLVVYDPVALQVVESSPAGASPRALTFHAKGAFDLAVRAAAGGGAYELTLEAFPPTDPLGERETNDTPTSAQYLGELLEGDAVRVAGNGGVAVPPRDHVLVICPEAARIDVRLEHGAGTDFDLHLFDATTDLGAPLPLLDLAASTTSPESGAIDVAPGTLVLVEVRAVAGGGTWLLELEGTTHGGMTKPGAAPRAAKPARRGVERRRLGARDDAPAYLRVNGGIVTGEALLGLREADGEERELASRGARVRTRAPGRRGLRRVVFDPPDGLDDVERARFTLARVRALGGCRGVRYAEPNRIRQACAEPDDTYYGFQWHYEQINLPQAWDRTTGSADVIVAVIDTGRTDHPDLAGRQAGGYDFISASWMARDGDGMDPDPTDVGDLGNGSSSTFHGTHVAGTIGAATDNGTGVAGVTWAGRIMHCRVLGRGGGTDFDIAQAILYAARLANASGALPPTRADVVNMSLGGAGFSQTLADACEDAHDAGVTLVAAAGNERTTAPSYPAAYPDVISVMAVDANASRARYSNTGSTVDLAAPGGDSSVDLTGDGYADGVLSTLYDDSQLPMVPVYQFYEGTSMASPHVAGVAALLLSVDATLTPSDVRDILTSTAQDLGATGRDDTYGHGLVDAYRAVLEAEGAPVLGPPEIEVSTSKLNFGIGLTTLFAEIRNVGGQPLQVTGVATETASGGAWLAAQVEGPGDATRSASRVRVTVNRVGLSRGTYLGTVRVLSDGGEAEIQVAMQKETAPPPLPNLTIFVQAVRVDTGQVVQTAEVNPSTSLVYRFPTLPIGEYVIRAFTDLDGDGLLGEAEDFQGAYPLPTDPIVLRVLKDQVIDRVDFKVTVPESLGPTEAKR